MKIDIQQTARDQSGFTLIEAMIALLIFSVGLLGLAGMQMSGLQNNHKSLMRTHAIQSSYDMADDLRARINNPNPRAGVAAWNVVLAGALPNGQGQVVPSAIVAGGFDISVFWDEDRTGVNGTNCPRQTANDLRCIKMTVVP